MQKLQFRPNPKLCRRFNGIFGRNRSRISRALEC